MLRLEGLKLPLEAGAEQLKAKAAALLRCREGDITGVQVLRRAIDARDGLRFVYTAAVTVKDEARLLKRCRDRHVSPYVPEAYTAAVRFRGGYAAGGGGHGPRGPVRRAGAGPLRRKAHPSGAGPVCRAPSDGRAALLAEGPAGHRVQRPVWRGRRRRFFRRQAEHRHQGHPPPLYFRGTGKMRCAGGDPL